MLCPDDLQRLLLFFVGSSVYLDFTAGLGFQMFGTRRYLWTNNPVQGSSPLVLRLQNLPRGFDIKPQALHVPNYWCQSGSFLLSVFLLAGDSCLTELLMPGMEEKALPCFFFDFSCCFATIHLKEVKPAVGLVGTKHKKVRRLCAPGKVASTIRHHPSRGA